jgi:hypothetical protein
MIRWPDAKELARAFAAGKPFRHVVIDGLVDAGDHARLLEGFGGEPLVPVEGEIYSHLRGMDPPMHATLRTFVDELGAAREAVSEICGVAVSRADGSAYAYREGDYLLPHSDHRSELGRAVAYAYYLAPPKSGGELDLYERTGKRATTRIAPRANRLVLFEVHDRALHEIREVLGGRRDSIAGWFYP